MYRLSDKEIEEAIKSTKSIAEAARKLELKYTGPLYKRAIGLGICKTNPAGKGICKRKKYKSESDVFVENGSPSTSALRHYLEKERDWKCEMCGISEWQGKKIPLQIHHMDGNRKNNLKENLQILCPNCHSITSSRCKQKHLR